MKEKKGFKMPSAFTVLLVLIIAIGILTHVIPGVQGASLADILGAPVLGFSSAMGVALFILILGGFLGIVNATGALNAGIGIVIKKLNGRELWIIPIIMFLISVGGTTFGMAEETIAFYAMMCTIMAAAGFDTIVAVGTIMFGSLTGVMGSTVNPFVVAISVAAMADAGLEVNQSVIIGVGTISWLVCYAMSAVYMVRYAKKVKADKSASLLTPQEQAAVVEKYGSGEENGSEAIVFTGKQKLVMILFALTFVVMILGVIPWSNFGVTLFDHTAFLTGAPLGSWWFADLSIWFLWCSILIGIIYGLKEGTIVHAFLDGAAGILSVSLIVAVSRGISVIMSTTGLDALILEKASQALAGTPAVLYTALAYLVLLVLSILIPSTSGLATASMPILAPLTAGLGLRHEVMVALLSGSVGAINGITPTSGILMGAISIGCIEWSTWVKFIWKLLVAIVVVHIIICSIAMMIL